jgi:hypothetical protein
MEGSTKEVKKRTCGGGRLYHPLAILLRNAFIILLGISCHALSQSFEVVIVEKPERLVAYDSYQQSLTSQGASPLRPFAPIKILNGHDVLGDGITPCARVDVDGQVLFLLRDESGRLAGWKNAGTTKIFQHIDFLNDTIEITGARTIALQHPVNGHVRMLPVGERCLRYFVRESVFYVKVLGPQPVYGWLSLPQVEKGKPWKIVRGEQTLTGLSPMILGRVSGKIRTINQSLIEVYTFLGRETGKKYPIPQWQIDSSKASIRYVLRPNAAAESYRESLHVLASTLRTYLLGTGYDAQEHNNGIDIRKQ